MTESLLFQILKYIRQVWPGLGLGAPSWGAGSHSLRVSWSRTHFAFKGHLGDDKATKKQILQCFTGIQSESLFVFFNITEDIVSDNSQV